MYLNIVFILQTTQLWQPKGCSREEWFKYSGCNKDHHETLVQKCKQIRQQMALDLNKETVSNTLHYVLYLVSISCGIVVVYVFFLFYTSIYILSGLLFS